MIAIALPTLRATPVFEDRDLPMLDIDLTRVRAVITAGAEALPLIDLSGALWNIPCWQAHLQTPDQAPIGVCQACAIISFKQFEALFYPGSFSLYSTVQRMTRAENLLAASHAFLAKRVAPYTFSEDKDNDASARTRDLAFARGNRSMKAYSLLHIRNSFSNCESKKRG